MILGLTEESCSKPIPSRSITPGPEALDHHVGAPDEREERLTPVGILQVDLHPARSREPLYA